MHVNTIITFNEFGNKLCINVQKGGTNICFETTNEDLQKLYNKNKSDICLSFCKKLMDDNKVKCIKSYDFSSVVEEWYNRDKSLHFKKENGSYAIHILKTDEFVFITSSDLKGKNLWTLSEVQLKRISNKKKVALEKSIQMVANLNFNDTEDLFQGALI